MDPFSGSLMARLAQAVTPQAIGRLMQGLAKWLIETIKSSLKEVLGFLWRTFWQGSLVGMVVVAALVVVAAELVMGAMGLPSGQQHQVMTTVGGVLLVAMLLRLMMYMVLGDRSRG